MKAKKIPYHLLLGLLTLGAVAIIGFLSFSGMWAIYPIVSLCVASFILSVAYEGEIYLQNIKGALAKLFKRNHLKDEIAKDYLLELFTNKKYPIDTSAADCPQFFKDYEKQLQALHEFSHKRLKKKSQLEKTLHEKSVKDSEQWFATQLSAVLYPETIAGKLQTPYELELAHWLKETIARDSLLKMFPENDNPSIDIPDIQFFREYSAQHQLLRTLRAKENLTEQESNEKTTIENKLKQMQKYFALHLFPNQTDSLTNEERSLREWLKNNESNTVKAGFEKRRTTYTSLKVFSAAAGVFMTIGITYLLVEAFAVLPLVSAIPFGVLPFIVVPMAIIAGAAYALLIYNAATDMVHHDSLRKWYFKIRDNLQKGLTIYSVSMALAAVFLFVLSIALTICTAGTWWTIVKNGKPIFGWMKTIGTGLAVGAATVIGIAQSFFNVQNIAESLELIDGAAKAKEGFWSIMSREFKAVLRHVAARENWLQVLNPFRLLIKLIVTPLRLFAFACHLISIAVTADRVPGIPEIATAIIGIISEGFEDLHYFVGDLLHSEHDHHGTKGLVKERLAAGHSHDHSNDIPTRIIYFLFTPIYYAAAFWDYSAARIASPITPFFKAELPAVANLASAAWDHFVGPDPEATEVSEQPAVLEPISWKDAKNKQRGLSRKESVTVNKNTSNEWLLEQTLHGLDHRIEKTVDKNKATQMNVFRNQLSTMENISEKKIKKGIAKEAENVVYSKHRNSFFSDGPTATQDFLNKDLPERISATSAPTAA